MSVTEDRSGAGAVPPRMLPPLTDVNRAFWTGGARGELLILRCPTCRRWVHPPRATCPDDGGALAPEPVSGRGTVFSFTINRHVYNPAVPPPYVIAIVELEEQAGLRFTTNIVGCAPEDVTMEMPVVVGFEAHGEVFVPVFSPA
ncbi:MAG: Zn-ribbon domain-containing OB-fold protein [Acidimicrobiia bacterium]